MTSEKELDNSHLALVDPKKELGKSKVAMGDSEKEFGNSHLAQVDSKKELGRSKLA